MWDAPLSQFQTSCLMFLASIAWAMRRQGKFQVDALSVPRRLTTRVSPPQSVLVELPFPGNQELLRVKNDIVLSKVIDGQSKRYFLNIVDTDNAPAHAIGAYIADLYSKAWNEAATKKCFDLDCIVLSDSIPGIISWRDVLKRRDLATVYTFRPDALEAAVRQEPKPAGLLDTIQFTAPLDKGLLDNRQVQFLDSHFQVDLLRFPQFQYVAVGGSFDNLHNGHRKLLLFAATLCTSEMTIGVTNETMLQHKANLEQIGSYAQRTQSVRDYLGEIKPGLPLCIAQLTEPYGPAITDPKLQALIVSSETIMGAFKINEIRRSKGFADMDIFVVSRGDGAILSSSFIREQKAKGVRA